MKRLLLIAALAVTLALAPGGAVGATHPSRIATGETTCDDLPTPELPVYFTCGDSSGLITNVFFRTPVFDAQLSAFDDNTGCVQLTSRRASRSERGCGELTVQIDPALRSGSVKGRLRDYDLAVLPGQLRLVSIDIDISITGDGTPDVLPFPPMTYVGADGVDVQQLVSIIRPSSAVGTINSTSLCAPTRDRRGRSHRPKGCVSGTGRNAAATYADLVSFQDVWAAAYTS